MTPSMTGFTREEYVALRSPIRTGLEPRSRISSHDSEESLRALEMEQSSSSSPSRHGRARSYSVSGFNFQQDLLPLSESVPEPLKAHNDGERTMGLMSGIALCVSLQIGSGIFSSPGVVVANTHSVGASLVVWLFSGLLAWTGASSHAELGSAIPQNGGAQAYLSYAYGPLTSYLFTWTAIIALKPGGGAIISLIFAEYLNRAFFGGGEGDLSDGIPQWAIKLTAVGAIFAVLLIGVATRNLGARAAVFFTITKIAALIFVMTLGIIQLARGKATATFSEPWFDDSSKSPSAYALALYSGLWAFDGWDQANYVGGEIRNPERNIPRAIHSSMAIVILLFLVANLSYFIVLDRDLVGLSNTVALDFGRHLWGPIGGTTFAILVAISCFGALNGGFLTSAHLICAAGREGFIPAVFGRLHSTRKTPLNAALLQATMTSVFVIIGGGFRSLINFAVVAAWPFYFLTVLGVVVLRIKEPLLERPYRTWIITPLIFCGVALFLLCMPIIAAPLEALAVCGFILTGIPVYYLTQGSRNQPRGFVWMSRLIARILGRRHVGDGWVAVSTEADEVEMTESNVRE